MVAYARDHGIATKVCGKLVVATAPSELGGLRALAERAVLNNVSARMLTPDEARAYEPHVRCVAALRVEPTAIVDYAEVCRSLADDIRTSGGQVHLDEAFVA